MLHRWHFIQQIKGMNNKYFKVMEAKMRMGRINELWPPPEEAYELQCWNFEFSHACTPYLHMCVYFTQWSTSIVSSKIRKQHKTINDSRILKTPNLLVLVLFLSIYWKEKGKREITERKKEKEKEKKTPVYDTGMKLSPLCKCLTRWVVL